MLVFVVKKRTKWQLVVEAGSLVVFQAVLRTVKETRICQLPVWATRRTVEETMPEVSRQKYPLTRVVLDCTELFIEKRSCFRAQSETYSLSKSHNTAKGLVAIAPNVRFVSDL